VAASAKLALLCARDLDDMTLTAYAEPPEPPTELLGLVSQVSPAMQGVYESIARFGYAHVGPGVLSDAEVRAGGLHVLRGLCVDTVHENTPEAQSAIRGDENLELLSRFGRNKRNE
jgi:hypothetical protein